MNSIEEKNETPKVSKRDTEQRQEGPRHPKGGQKKKKKDNLKSRP